MQFIDLQAQRQRIKNEIQVAMNRVLEHGKFILGPEVGELENRLSEFTGAAHCITCANGTDALQIALMALGVQPGDEVIVPAFTYIASAEAVAILGAKPVFVDIEPDTFNIDAGLMAQAITPKTKAIIAVSLFGQCPDFSAINAIAAKHNIPVVEDAAQSFGAQQNGTRSCNLSTIACTSFFPAKPLGCYGDGGAIFTSDSELAEKAKLIARHGQTRRYVHEVVGMNSRLDTLQAAILLEKLAIYEDEIERRNQVAQWYAEALRDCPVTLPTIKPENLSVFAQYTIRTSQREALQAQLKEKGIPTAVHYPVSLHHQPVFNEYSGLSLLNSEQAAAEVMSLPMHPYLQQEEVQHIAEVVREAAQAVS